MNFTRMTLVFLLCLFSWSAAAEELVSEEESLKYYFSLIQKGKTYRVHPGAAPRYLRGVWRLDRKAHVGAGHYARAENGDDVVLICNDERLIQIDFNREGDTFVEFTGQLSDLTGAADGSMHFGKEKRFITPLDENHLSVAQYDYIVVLERVSGAPDREGPAAYPANPQE